MNLTVHGSAYDYADQTRLFSQKRWVPDRFCMTGVLRDTKRTLVLEHSR